MYPSPVWHMPYIYNPDLPLPGTIRLRTPMWEAEMRSRAAWRRRGGPAPRSPVGELPVSAQAVAMDQALESDLPESGLPESGAAATGADQT